MAMYAFNGQLLELTCDGTVQDITFPDGMVRIQRLLIFMREKGLTGGAVVDTANPVNFKFYKTADKSDTPTEFSLSGGEQFLLDELDFLAGTYEGTNTDKFLLQMDGDAI